jgi:hypothetical protein
MGIHLLIRTAQRALALAKQASQSGWRILTAYAARAMAHGRNVRIFFSLKKIAKPCA